jgi:predicted AlkP superfamily phosphohydrolase/phosphomutase
VFDGTDRLQHMFWRDIDPTHPARKEHPVPDGRNVIEDLYKSMDDLVGRTMAKCPRDETLFLVISDHGFNGFRRGLDLNRWLEESGYLKFHEGRRGEEHLAGVDWTQTRAFAIGLTGVFINLKGKFAQGIVEPGADADKLRDEIAERLSGLIDPENGASAIKRAYVSAKVYRGPYKDDAPDIIPGYQRGYRVSWETAIGRTTESVFHDNTKAWSGDHCIDPSLIPGVLFSNHPVQTEQCRLMDIGPTILDMFGVPVPEHMDGKKLVVAGAGADTRANKAGERGALAPCS